MTHVDGGAELGSLARRLREAERRDLTRELRRGLERGVALLSAAILEGIPARMPAGYEVTLAESMNFATSVRTAGRRAVVEHVSRARGKSRLRKIGDLNQGILKHPVHGRYRRVEGRLKPNPWVRQTIPRGFWDTPVDENKDKVRDEARAAMHRVGQKITKG